MILTRKMRISSTLIIAGLAASVLTGCKSLYGQYERPKVNTTGLVRDSSAVGAADTLVAADTASFGNMEWRQVFTDAKLQYLINKALKNNPDYLNAALNVDMAEAQLKAAKLSFLPSFSFTPQGTIASWDGGAATKTYSLPVNASWNVDLWGNLLSQKRSAQMALLQTKDYQVSVQTNLIANVANLYYTLCMLDKQLELVGNMKTLVKDTWDIMKVQKDLSMGIRSTGVQAAESNYYSVLTQETDIKRQIRETENSLSLLVGQPVQSIQRNSLDSQSLPGKFSTGIGLQLLRNRADVHAAEMNLAQCFYGIETARSRFYPALNISASGVFTNNGGGMITNPGKWLLSAVGALTQPIFQNGKLIAGLRVAKDQYQQAYNKWQNTIYKAGSEVSNALVLYNSSAEKSAIEKQQEEVLEKNVEDTKALLQSSSNQTYLEVIQAQSSLLNTQLSRVQDDFYKMQAVVNLYYALGGGAK